MFPWKFIGWAAFVTILGAVAYGTSAYEVSHTVFWAWLGTLLATSISVLAAVVVGLLLFNYQTEVADERKRCGLALLAVTELQEIINTLQPDDPKTFKAVFVHSPMVEQAARSGLLDPQTTADMMRLAWYVQHYNSMVSQYQTVMYSMGINPNAQTFVNVLLSLCRDNRDVVIRSAQHVLTEVLQGYPEAFIYD
jgi:hypothetical protein